jgi:thymidine kinase
MTNRQKMTQPKGYLEIYLGPMYSGKTSKLLDIYKQYSFCNISVEVINHSSDTRYHNSMLSTHDKVMIPCIQTNNLMDVWENRDVDDIFNEISSNHLKLRSAEVIIINEGQFFSDLYECVIDMLKEKKRVYIAGLDGDFERKKFGQILDLIPMCDSVTKLKSLCSICKNGEFGVFSLRLSEEKQQTLVGSDNYIPVCRSCYDKNSEMSFHSLNILENYLN